MRIATFNINNINKQLANLLDWLAAENPDVVCLQELKGDQRPDGVRGQRLYAHRLVESGSGQMSQAPSIVTISLVRPQGLQRLISMPALDANDRQAKLHQPVIELRRHPTGLKRHALTSRLDHPKGAGQTNERQIRVHLNPLCLAMNRGPAPDRPPRSRSGARRDQCDGPLSRRAQRRLSDRASSLAWMLASSAGLNQPRWRRRAVSCRRMTFKDRRARLAS